MTGTSEAYSLQQRAHTRFKIQAQTGAECVSGVLTWWADVWRQRAMAVRSLCLREQKHQQLSFGRMKSFDLIPIVA